MTTITTQTTSPTRRVAVNALAIVGFVVLIILGMALAVYAATFVPKAVTRLGGAAVYLSSLFVPAETPAKLEVVAPVAVVPFPDSPDAGIATTSPVTPVSPAITPAAITGPKTTTAYVVGTAPSSTNLTGFSDLQATIDAVGYLSNGSDEASFVKSSTIPRELWGAVKFTVRNAGTNISGTYTLDVSVPTSRTYTLHSAAQDSLAPGGIIQYTVRFERGNVGTDREVTVTIDPDNRVHEINESNNSASASVEIK